MCQLVNPALREVMARKVLDLASPPPSTGPSPPPDHTLLHKLLAGQTPPLLALHLPDTLFSLIVVVAFACLTPFSLWWSLLH